jgi:hypothetical protein
VDARSGDETTPDEPSPNVDAAAADAKRGAAPVVVCKCGHARSAHRHYRSGSDCALCAGACRSFRLRINASAIKEFWRRGGRNGPR